ncbi:MULTISPECIES: hypothetical protein [Streptomyces]|uniref:Uncharacterized protein n=2 Tax=Streptomyces rimosus subsp. rimosus TaxID=132474 RepID=L8ER88_STRR1|nr:MULTISPECIES: hypothetical protein [Streptomyces]KOG67991.1 hypothetical protein ADK78_37985 [Kitasatospora aureofaciens]MYT42689.1 hypothetical protein [Streptomyces sp. SID5471]KEF06451.1 hypothetical protein DF17_14115 [Streptomyces rimosus]KEF21498.1 hypothetical protein DF18_04910 [Streptomyces rimosus]KOT32820.1 hypothetical protein ADK42_25445 [Streptomyces rimosus subsp. rimosus]
MANELRYGAQIHLQNGYNGWQGGYLDTNSHSSASGGKYQVATADTPTRGKGTGTWEVLSATGKAAGQPVVSGDVIYLRNLYGGDGGYLDTNGHATNEQKNAGAKYDVSTSQTRDRAQGTGRWRIFARTSSPADQNVRIGDVVHLWNLYGDNGGFLETNNTSALTDAKYDLCTNAYYNRSSDVADWKIHQAQG